MKRCHYKLWYKTLVCGIRYINIVLQNWFLNFHWQITFGQIDGKQSYSLHFKADRNLSRNFFTYFDVLNPFLKLLQTRWGTASNACSKGYLPIPNYPPPQPQLLPESWVIKRALLAQILVEIHNLKYLSEPTQPNFRTAFQDLK